MSNQAVSLHSQPIATSPLSYEVKRIRLYTNLDESEQYINLEGALRTITIEESIHKLGIEVIISLLDTQSLLELFKLGGNEKVEIVLGRIDVEKQEDFTFDLTLNVTDIQNYSRRSRFEQYYDLVCVPEFVYNSQAKKLTRSFGGTIGTLIKNIFKNDLLVEEPLAIDESGGIVHGIYPRISPLYAIEWLLKNAHKNETPYYCYQYAKNEDSGKIKFESFQDMVDQDIYDTYKYEPFFKPSDSTDQNTTPLETYQNERRKIQSISSNLDISKLRLLGEGGLASTLHVIDYSDKSYNTHQHKHEDPIQLNEKVSYSKNVKFLNDKFTDLVDSKHFFLNKNSLAFENNTNYHNVNDQTILANNAYLRNFDTHSQEIVVAGDFNLRAGMKIEVKIERVLNTNDSLIWDEYFSGNYIIEKITHMFDNTFTQRIMLKKDSFITDMDDILRVKRKDGDADEA